MTQEERVDYLINYLVSENPVHKYLEIPTSYNEKRSLLRALFNVRPASTADDDFIKIQDEFLQEEIFSKGITKITDIEDVFEDLYLWKGDITTLESDAIVNAANSGLTGCYRPNHMCIDNAIHTFSGIQLRNYCSNIIKEQGHDEETGTAKITPAFNLPSKYIIHTVGPIVGGPLTDKHCKELESCYSECLKVAIDAKLSSIAFCCISTGVFMFPNKKAAEIALKTIKRIKSDYSSQIKVIINVFKNEDYEIYKNLLKQNIECT